MSSRWSSSSASARQLTALPGAGFDARVSSSSSSDLNRRVCPSSSFSVTAPSSRPLQLLTYDDDISTASSNHHRHGNPTIKDDGDDIDPLDAYMASLSEPISHRAADVTQATNAVSKNKIDDEDEIDPLDAYMQSITSNITTSSRAVIAPITSSSSSAALSLSSSSSSSSSSRLSLDDADDDMLTFVALQSDRLVHQAAAAGTTVDEVKRVERKRYKREEDNDGDARSGDDDAAASSSSSTRRGGVDLASLVPIDHASISYPPFLSSFYTPCEEVTSLPAEEVSALMEDLDIIVTGPVHPRLCYRWSHFGFDSTLLQHITVNRSFDRPTPIQSQAMPIIMMGKDMIGMAQTGSGKTAAYVWPLLVHLLGSPPLPPFLGPRCLILAPTRELCDQIYHECHRYLHLYNLRTSLVVGGNQKYEQVKSIAAGVEVVVATPGRLVELMIDQTFTCDLITYVVLDEADRLLSMGFSQQLSAILGQIRPDRQMILFSATMNPAVERLARTHMNDPVRVMIGSGGANDIIQQRMELVKGDDAKCEWLRSHIDEFIAKGSIIVFCATIAACEELMKKLMGAKGNNGKNNNSHHRYDQHQHHSSRTNSSISTLPAPLYDVLCLHGDLPQSTRSSVLARFKSLTLPPSILVATDVAARGLDIPSLPTVICYDIARTIDSHTHRIGRTGRAKAKNGMAITIVDEEAKDDAKYVASIIDSIDEAGQMEMQSEQVKEMVRRRNGGHGGGSGMRGGRGGGGGGGAGSNRGGRNDVHSSSSSYNNVPPPSHRPALPSYPSSSHLSSSHPSSSHSHPAIITSSSLPSASLSSSSSTPTSTPSMVHPSRMAQVPGAKMITNHMPHSSSSSSLLSSSSSYNQYGNNHVSTSSSASHPSSTYANGTSASPSFSQPLPLPPSSALPSPYPLPPRPLIPSFHPSSPSLLLPLPPPPSSHSIASIQSHSLSPANIVVIDANIVPQRKKSRWDK